MTFEEWIDEIGISALAQKLKVHPGTVDNWRRGKNDPKVDYMRLIRRLSGNKITYEQMIDRPVLMSRVSPNRNYGKL